MSNGKSGPLPGAVAAEQVRDVPEACRGQPAGRHHRAVAAGAVGDHGKVAVQRVERVGEDGQRDLHRPGYRPVRRLRRGADVDQLQVGFQACQLGQLPDGEPGAALGQLRPAWQHRRGLGQLAHDLVQADPGQADPGLGGERWVTDQHDVPAGRQDIARPLGEAALQADVDRPGHMGGREVGRLAWVEENRAGVPPGQDVGEVEQARGVFVQQGV